MKLVVTAFATARVQEYLRWYCEISPDVTVVHTASPAELQQVLQNRTPQVVIVEILESEDSDTACGEIQRRISQTSRILKQHPVPVILTGWPETISVLASPDSETYYPAQLPHPYSGRCVLNHVVGRILEASPQKPTVPVQASVTVTSRTTRKRPAVRGGICCMMPALHLATAGAE